MLDQLNFEAIRMARSAAARTRFVTTLIIIAAVLATLAYWNSKPDSWPRLRYERQYLLEEVRDLVKERIEKDSLLSYRQFLLRTKGVEVFPEDDRPTVKAKAMKALNSEVIDRDMYDRIDEPVVDTNFIDMLRADVPGRFTSTKWGKLRTSMIGLKDWKNELDYAKEYAAQLRSGYIDTSLLVNIPFFGPAFDINDLALFAGLVLNLMLIALCYVIIREQHTVDTLSEIVKELDSTQASSDIIKRRVYQVTANANVLTMPPILLAKRPMSIVQLEFDRWTRTGFTILGFLMRLFPFVVYGFIFFNDRNTREFGMTLSPSRMSTLEDISLIFLILLGLSTLMVLFTNWRLELRWRDLAREVSEA